MGTMAAALGVALLVAILGVAWANAAFDDIERQMRGE